MYFLLVAGLMLGLLVYGFFFIISKFKEQYYLAPLLTFFTAFVVVIYGFFFVRGFEGMSYTFFSVGIFLVSVLGMIVLPLLAKSSKLTKITIWDKIGLIIFPVTFFTIIFTLT
ncbi:YesK family protein [Alkalibacillus sp. S2W]|uniref:YesK family protein n=1 Tax=Alkalibacillus sp. S2W TaxID=3386553 RepID=UPI00398CB166